MCACSERSGRKELGAFDVSAATTPEHLHVIAQTPLIKALHTTIRAADTVDIVFT